MLWFKSPFEDLRSPFEKYTVSKQRSAHGNMVDRYHFPFYSIHNFLQDATCRSQDPINILTANCRLGTKDSSYPSRV